MDWLRKLLGINYEYKISHVHEQFFSIYKLKNGEIIAEYSGFSMRWTPITNVKKPSHKVRKKFYRLWLDEKKRIARKRCEEIEQIIRDHGGKSIAQINKEKKGK